MCQKLSIIACFILTTNLMAHNTNNTSYIALQVPAGLNTALYHSSYQKYHAIGRLVSIGLLWSIGVSAYIYERTLHRSIPKTLDTFAYANFFGLVTMPLLGFYHAIKANQHIFSIPKECHDAIESFLNNALVNGIILVSIPPIVVDAVMDKPYQNSNRDIIIKVMFIVGYLLETVSSVASYFRTSDSHQCIVNSVGATAAINQKSEL